MTAEHMHESTAADFECIPEPKTSENRVNKAAFVRAQPMSLRAKDVVRSAADRGIMISVSDVYMARKYMRRKERSAKVVAQEKASHVATAPSVSAFRAMVLEIGLSTARRVMKEIEDRKGTP